MSNRYKVLFLLKVPPPVHGSTLMNQIVLNSKLIRDSFDSNYFPVSISKDVGDIGKFSLRKLFSIFSDYLDLYKELKKTEPNLIYFTVSPYGMAFLKDYIFFLIISRFKVPVLFHHHGKGAKNYAQVKPFFKRLYLSMYGKNSHICLAKELIEDIQPFIQNRPFIIPNGIEENFKLESKASVGNECRKIIYLSNFTRSKGIIDLLDAARLLKERTVNFTLSLVGKSYDISESEVQNIINEYELSDFVKIKGPKYGKEKFEFISGHDFFIFPTYYPNECFPVVLLEAFQCGLPCISTNEGGIPSLIDEGLNGFVVDKHDFHTLAEKMEYFINNPAACKKMGQNARQKFEREYTVDNFERNIISTIHNVLNTQ